MNKDRIKVAILGATGYTGLELLRILSYHPKVQITIATSQKYAGKKLVDLFPFFKNELVLTPLDYNLIADNADIIFTALPQQVSMEVVPEIWRLKKKIIDLSADFRLKKPEVYEAWYGPHKAKELISKAVYGLPEIYREYIKNAHLIANPGCYPTPVILALVPLLDKHIIKENSIVVDAKSGVSGAGRSLKLSSLFCEVNEGMQAYKVAAHRHIPEMDQELSKLAGKDIHITFVPHLIPISRGMFTTAYASLKSKLSTEQAYQIMNEYYQGETFVKVLLPPQIPQTLHVRGTNECHMGVKVDERNNCIIVMAAIDNLGKGASTQAVQNMNLMAGLPEEAGLEPLPLFL